VSSLAAACFRFRAELTFLPPQLPTSLNKVQTAHVRPFRLNRNAADLRDDPLQLAGLSGRATGEIKSVEWGKARAQTDVKDMMAPRLRKRFLASLRLNTDIPADIVTFYTLLINEALAKRRFKTRKSRYYICSPQFGITLRDGDTPPIPQVWDGTAMVSGLRAGGVEQSSRRTLRRWM